MSQGVVHLVVNSYTVGLSGLAKLPFADEGIIDYMTTFNGHLSFRNWKMSLDCDRAQLITNMAEVIECYREGYSSSNTSFLVFIYVGHAKDDYIVMNDGDRINFYDIVDRYANGLPRARKIFIFDGCRDTLTDLIAPRHPNCIFLYSALPCQIAHWGIERGHYGIGSYFLNQELRTNVGNLETVVGTVNEKLKKQCGSDQAFQYINNDATPVILYIRKECTEIDNIDLQLQEELQYITTRMKKYREENLDIVKEHLKSRGQLNDSSEGSSSHPKKGRESPLPIFPPSHTPLQDAIQSVYTILVNQLCVKDIREDLFAQGIIDMPLNQTIQNKSNSKEANEALVNHLYRNGTVGLVERFIQVLRDTSLMYAVHKEIAETLEGALSDHNVMVQSLPGQPENVPPQNVPPQNVQEVDLNQSILPDPLLKLQENAFYEYKSYKLAEGDSEVRFVRLAIVKNKPSVLETKGDQLETLKRLRECGPKSDIEGHIDVKDLAKQCKDRIRIIYGQAGTGKTTAMKHICQQVALSQIKSDFALILFFPLRDESVSKCTDLPSLLDYYREGYFEDIIMATKMLKEGNGRDTLLIFDGADEARELLQEGSNSVLLKLLKGKLLPEASIILSSRPGICSEPQKYANQFYEVQGFDEVAIEAFVKEFFKDDPISAERMLQTIRDRPDLKGGAYIPMNLFIFCSTFKANQYSLPATITECYQGHVSDLCSRECEKEGRDVYIDPTLSELPEDLQDLLWRLGELAFKGLTAKPSKYIFTEQAIRKIFPEIKGKPHDSLFKGLLHLRIEKHGFRPTFSGNFSHVTLQEFFSALHLSRLSEKDQVMFWKEHISNPSFAVVLRFYAGLTKLTCKDFIPSCLVMPPSTPTTAAPPNVAGATLQLPAKSDRGNPQLLFLLHVLHESQNETVICETLKHLNSSLKFSDLGSFDVMVVLNCLAHCTHLIELEMNGSRNPFPVGSVKRLLHSNQNLQKLRGCVLDHLTEDDAVTMFTRTCSMKKLELNITKSTSASALMRVFSWKGLETLRLDLSGCTITESEGSSLEELVPSNLSLKEFSLDCSDAKILSHRQFFDCLSIVTSLSSLEKCDVKLPELSEGDAVTMFTRTCSMKKLELNITKSTSASALMRVFSWKGLETLRLDLSGCTITDVVREDVLTSLEQSVKNTTLECLTVNGGVCVNWTNVAESILKGAAANQNLRELELVTNEKCKEYAPKQEVIDHVRKINKKLKLTVKFDDTKVTKLLDSQEFLELLQEGAITLQITKCTTIGPPRKGKTHLKYLLTNQLWDYVGSTVTMVAPEWVEVYSSSKDSIWKLYDRTERETHILQDMKGDIYMPKDQDEEDLTEDSKIEKSPSPKLEQEQSCTTSSEVVQAGSLQEAKTSIPTQQQLHKAKPEQEKEISLDKGNAESLEHAEEQSDSKSPSSGLQLLNDAYSDIEEEFRTKLQQVQQSETRSHRERIIHFIDTGGQAIYHDVHPVLITSPSVYLLVFSLKDLQDNPSADFLSHDLLVKALRSIQTLGTKQPVNDEYLKLHPEYPKIFIVGTHKDQINSDECDDFLQMVHDKVEANLKNKPYSDYVCYDTNGRSFWSVDNTQAGDKAVDQEYYNGLRRRVQSGSTTIEVTLPPSWYLLEHFTHQHKQKCLLYPDLKEFSAERKLVKKKHFRAMVDLFHILGFYYYKIPHGYTKEESVIFTDPNFLYKITSKLLQKIENELESNAERKISPKNVFINVLKYLETMDDLKDMEIDPNWFASLLQELFLIAKIKFQESLSDLSPSSWIVPAALPRGPEADPSDSSLLFTLIAPITKSIPFIPSGLFCSLMASLTSRGWRPEEFYRNNAVFTVSASCHVTIREHDSFIEVSYKAIGQSSEEEYNQVTVRETISKRLSEIQKVLYKDLGSSTDQRLASATRVCLGFLCTCRGGVFSPHDVTISDKDVHDSFTGASQVHPPGSLFHFAEYLEEDMNICAECTEPESSFFQDVTEKQLQWFC